MDERREYAAASGWALATAFAILGLIYTLPLFGFGLVFVAPLFAWLDKHAVVGRARYGIVLGAAVLPAWLAWYHGGYQACPASSADMADGNWHCGGTNPTPFLVMALVMVLAFGVLWMLGKGPSTPRNVSNERRVRAIG